MRRGVRAILAASQGVGTTSRRSVMLAMSGAGNA